MVVTEMNTPMSAPARASVSETTPTIPASTATTSENKFGLSISAETGRTPARYSFGVRPDQRMIRPKIRVMTIAAENPASRARAPRMTGRRRRLSRPSATPMIALYSGPTTMAPTTRIWELVRMPTAPISPAMISRM